MLILDAVGLQIRRSDGAGKWVHLMTQIHAPIFHTSLIFNLSLDLWSLAKQECFSCKDTTNGTVQSDFPFFSFDSFLFVRFVVINQKNVLFNIL